MTWLTIFNLVLVFLLLILNMQLLTGCVSVLTSIHREGFICLDQLEYLGTDQRCYVKDVSFLCQVPSSLLENAAPNPSN